MGMLAGSLVNESDARRSLFVPDVAFPEVKETGESLVFYSQLPQALSTEAEMMTRYSGGTEPDGKSSCIQRIHVTGGTNGILVDCLRSYRPFTPSFFGRAEDQAYLLSVLFEMREGGYLRYAHRYGLVMRHDKEAFAGEAIEAARIGKMVGDYQRTLLFSHYASHILPWPEKDIKDAIDPFTGCFVSRIPFTVVYLRFALKAMEMCARNLQDGALFIRSGAPRIREVMGKISGGGQYYLKAFRREKRGWDDFHDILDAVERSTEKGDAGMNDIISGARDIISGCEVNIDRDS